MRAGRKMWEKQFEIMTADSQMQAFARPQHRV